MHRHNLRGSFFRFAGLWVLAVLVLLAWKLQQTSSPRSSPAVAGAAPGLSAPLDPAADGALVRPPRVPKAPQAALETGRAWQIADSSAGERSFVIALNEAVLRDADGKESFVPLDPPASEETLRARLETLAADRGLAAWPVAYLAGEARSEATRRILTPDLRVHAEAADPNEIARTAGVVIKDLPAYAPGWAVLEAADPLAALDALDRLRASGHVSADVLLAVQRQKRAMPNDTLIAQQWHLRNTQSTRTHVNVETAWNFPGSGMRGTGIRIGIIDDGMQTAHPDLTTNVDTANDKDWNGNDNDPNPGSGDDHGTACAGNAAARGNNSLGVSGTAPAATLVGLRLIAASVTDAQEAEAMAWRNDIIQIKNNSWGPDDTGSNVEAPGPLTASAFANGTQSGRGGRGTIYLWAGGNGGDSEDNSNYDGYANSIHTIAVGASDSTGNRSSFSEPGANIVIVAPSSGVTGITTTDRTGSVGYSSGDYANDFGGTSSATPTAAGVVALMLEKNPNLGWRDVQEILIRSAYKIKPTDAGWSQNGAGISFNHDFGAGLVDATAAVNLANGWTNLQAQQTSTQTQSNSTAIPDNNATGITRSFNFSATNLRVEHATVRLNITHPYRGDLEISLTSPSGMVSRLAEDRSDGNDNYSNWTFTSVRHWGENASGTWTLKIADRSSSDTGTLTSATITLYGSSVALVNPAPLVQITSPLNGAVFSPGTPVDVVVSAEDLTGSGTPGVINLVELLQNGVVVDSKNAPPYQFTLSPAPGSHTLVARATDSEGATGTSASISISVANQAPVITAAALNAGPQAYADEGLAVDSITASDPENSPLDYAYQWQASVDGASYENVAEFTAAALPPSAGLAAKLWRCRITASDGETTSAPFLTAATNLLKRPPPSAALGGTFSHDTGLVLRGGSSTITRQALINEFSQGPVGDSSEWIEILTLQPGSLAYWDIQDANGDMLVFNDAPVWDNIPAGTTIVIYNGTAAKDPLLPADDSDPADGRLVLSSTNPAFFDADFDAWPSLSNTGDSIFLNDGDANTIHELAYGTSTAATPNIGSVGSGQAAYYIGGDDTGADIAANWRGTTALTSRTFSPRAPGDLFISEYVAGTSNNKALELYNPSSASVDLSAAGYKIEIYYNGSSSAATTIFLTGSVTPGGTFVIRHSSASIVVNYQQQTSSLTFNGDDAIVLRKGTAAVDSLGQVGFDPGTAWTSNGVTTVDKTLRRKPEITEGDLVTNNAFDPSAEWMQFNLNDVTGLGSHALLEPDPQLVLAVSPTSIAENAGAFAATGSVRIPKALQANLTVTLTNSNAAAVTAPTSVLIQAGQTAATFFVGAVDDDLSNGLRTVTFTASANGYLPAEFAITVTDDEPSMDGVTPGGGNSPANTAFIAELLGGFYGSPALYRLGAGSLLPLGLTLDEQTGLLSGVIDPSNTPADYPIIIERYNPQGEVVSTSFVLAVATVTEPDYAAWVAAYSAQLGGLTGRSDDPDGDGLPNAVENLLGTSPAEANQGVLQVSANTNTLVFYHTLSANPASDVTAAYQWSANLATWQESGESADATRVSFTTATVVDDAHPQGWIQVTATVTEGAPARIFARLVAR
jgi:subtilisin-like proprotein convertase family protein